MRNRVLPSELLVTHREFRENKGWLYLAVILDLYSHAMIGWAMGARQTGDLTQNALGAPAAHPTAGLRHHSGRGSRYAPRGAITYSPRTASLRAYSDGELLGQCLCREFLRDTPA